MTQTTHARRNGHSTDTPAAVAGPLIPADMQAEEAVLGAILSDSRGLIHIARWLHPNHVYLERHRKIYEAMRA